MLEPDRDLAEVARNIAAETGGFTGGNLELFEGVGRFTLDSLVELGMRPEHRALDVGCGALRIGYWLIRYLAPGNYFGLEPNRKYVDVGLRHAVGAALQAEMNPTFRFESDFDFGAFRVPFDFVVARSIFSHASPQQIERAMGSFRDSAAPGGVMIASYRPLRKQDAGLDVFDSKSNGREWGFRRYSLPFLQAMASRQSLTADTYGEVFNGQVWLRMTKAAPATR